MQVTDYSFKSQPAFGMKVSKIGRQIDKVLEQDGLVNGEVTRLRFMLEDHFMNDFDAQKPLGVGFYGRIYPIDDKYVFKCCNAQFPDVERGELVIKKNSALNCLKTYFGAILMQLGNIKILRNVSSEGKHTPVGIPRLMLTKNFSEDELFYYYNNIYLPQFASLPQRSFDRIAGDFGNLNKSSNACYGLQFDTNNPNNIVLVGTSTLRIVDDINEVLEAEPNRVCGLLDMFLKKANTSMLAPQTDENRMLRFELFKKVVLAGERYKLPLSSGSDYDKNVWNIVCDFGQSGEEVLSDLNKIRSTTNSTRERLKCVNAFLEKLKTCVDK